MSKKEGWIKIKRKTLDWEWYSHPNTKLLWFHLLLTVNHAPGRWRGVDVAPGQTITGRKKLSKETGLSEQQIRTAIFNLKKTGEITIKPTTKHSIVTVVNWVKYQIEDGQPTNDQPSNQPTGNHQSTTNKKNNNKQESKNTVVPIRPDVDKSVDNFSGVNLKTETYEKARLIAFGWDIYKLEKMWIASGYVKTANDPDKSYLGFVESHVKRNRM